MRSYKERCGRKIGNQIGHEKKESEKKLEIFPDAALGLDHEIVGHDLYKYRGISLSSVPCERLYSIAGNIASDERNPSWIPVDLRDCRF
ncbi:hypothetical protein TNCV_2853101 [Trichonephila clavipes]|uniref:Uncharacterized protein n=1 Tax=Trichonephila clavipes TaxID=2585209 RepID=A0A8X6REM3_TRICX|nr:hypothetical protein TNCV_2853101 [Trichonephila clavipes]